MPDTTPSAPPGTDDRKPSRPLAELTGGATGAGIVLVLFPCLGLYYGMHRIHDFQSVGLPLMAIFGIMILFGAMALVSTLFHRLGLTSPSEALALPPGSIRAVIALSLIVLFAIISIMLFQSMASQTIVTMRGLSLADKTAIVGNAANRIDSIVRVECAAGRAGATESPPAAESPPAEAAPPAPIASPESCFDVQIVRTAGQEAVDVAKQLLILIGTLMTSVTSFYFATQATVAAVKSVSRPGGEDTQTNPAAPASQGGDGGTAAATTGQSAVRGSATTGTVAVAATPSPDGTHGEHEDGCDVPITDPTDDLALPPTKGGVAP